MVRSQHQEKFYERSYAKELMNIAKADLKSARNLAGIERERIENVYFLAQQALEKALKAVICHDAQPIPFTHDLELLADRVRANHQLPFTYNLYSLTEYAAIRRYLQGYEKYSAEEVMDVLNAVGSAVEWASTIVLGPEKATS